MRFQFKIFSLLLISSGTLAANNSPVNNMHHLHANDPATNVVIFGDSLSDTGNYPEPKAVQTPTVKNFNLYIPVSSPVPKQKYGTRITDIAMPSTHYPDWFYPSYSFLQNSIGSQGTMEGQAKPLYSINWPLYLIYNLQQQTQPATDVPLTTWYQFKFSATPHTDVPQYLNYAWASAISNDHCNLDDYSVTTRCDTGTPEATEGAIKTARDSYLSDSDPMKFNDLLIPGLLKQITLYTHDVSKPSNSTDYFIYIGANDISSAMKNDLLHLKILKFWADIGTKNNPGTIAKNVEAAVQRIKSFQGSNTHYKIYVLTLFNVANTPEAYHFADKIKIIGPIVRDLLKGILSSCVKAYNSELSALYLKADGSPKDPQVQLIDLGQKMDDWAASPTFKDSVQHGEACFAPQYTDPKITTNDNCSEGAGSKNYYYAWNAAHFSSVVNAAAANYVYGSMLHAEGKPVPITYPDTLSGDVEKFKHYLEGKLDASEVAGPYVN